MTALAETKQPLTQAQQRVLDVIKGYIEQHGIAPSRTEIKAACGYSAIRSAQSHVEALARKGWIEITTYVPRGLRLL